jgi:hypothetical protein
MPKRKRTPTLALKNPKMTADEAFDVCKSIEKELLIWSQRSSRLAEQTSDEKVRDHFLKLQRNQDWLAESFRAEAALLNPQIKKSSKPEKDKVLERTSRYHRGYLKELKRANERRAALPYKPREPKKNKPKPFDAPLGKY